MGSNDHLRISTLYAYSRCSALHSHIALSLAGVGEGGSTTLSVIGDGEFLTLSLESVVNSAT